MSERFDMRKYIGLYFSLCTKLFQITASISAPLIFVIATIRVHSHILDIVIDRHLLLYHQIFDYIY